jgi:general secretion pathway protein D
MGAGMKKTRHVLNKKQITMVVGLVLLLLFLSGCASKKAYHSAERSMRRLNFDAAVVDYSKAVALDPGNTTYSVALERARLKASAEHFEKGKRYYKAHQYELAIAEYQQTLILNPGNQHATTEMNKAMRTLQQMSVGPGMIDLLKEQARRKDLGPPKLDPRANIPILLNFQEVETARIFEAIGKASGINFIFDDKVDLDREMTVDIGNVTMEKALDILMLQTKNFYKVIDEYTLLIAPDTRQKRQEYEDQVIRTFFLSNADTKTVVTLLRSLLQSRQIAENADLNSVTIKDTPAKVAIAERIIVANDKSKGEVLIDVELLEINRTVAQTLGIDLSSKTLSVQFRDGAQSLPLNNLKVLKQAGSWTVGVIPTVLLSFLKSDSDSRLIAKPQLRVTEGEKAEILIGDRIPIPTTSFNTSQTIGGNIVPITSFTYNNVGITVQIEPRVHHNKEVTLTVSVEISQVTGAVETGGGVSQPIIGTRQIQTVIRLRDGETNLLAGLIQRTDTDSYAGVSGLSNIPGLRRLAGGSDTQKTETDIIMTLTPRIIRIPDITEEDLMTLWVGTEDNMRLRGSARTALAQSPFGAPKLAGEGSGNGSTTPPTGGGVSRALSPNEPELPDPGTTTSREDDLAATGSDPGNINDSAAPPVTAPPTQPEADEPGGNADEADELEADDDPQVTVVRLLTGSNRGSVGETLMVQVLVNDAQNVGSIPFHLRFNNQVLQFVPPALEGDLLRSGGANTVLFADDPRGGELIYGHSRLGGQEGATGSGVLSTLQFLIVGSGQANFQFVDASVQDTRAIRKPAQFLSIPFTVLP